MQVCRQFTIFMANKPGQLAHLTSEFARRKVNISALTVVDSREHSVLRVVTTPADAGRDVLRQLNLPYQETEVIEVEIQNRPGAFARICELLSLEHINIDYAYCSASTRQGKTLGILHVSNLPRAMKLLKEQAAPRPRNGPGRRPIFSR